MLWAAVLLALTAALVFAFSAVAQQQEAANVDAHGSGFVTGLLRSPRWWVATLGDGCGYLIQAAALGVGSILVVQPLLIASLVFSLPLSARWNARPVRRRDVAWAGVIAGGLAVFLLVGDPGGGRNTNSLGHWLPSIIGCGLLAGVGLAWAAMRGPRGRSIGLAIVAGTMFGLASALTKTLMFHLDEGIEPLLRSWETYGVVGTGAIGLLCQQLAFQAGSLEISFPAAIVLDPVVSVAVGMAALDERVHAGGLEWLLIGLSGVAMISGTIALARAGVPTLTTRKGDDPPPATNATSWFTRRQPRPPTASARVPTHRERESARTATGRTEASGIPRPRRTTR